MAVYVLIDFIPESRIFFPVTGPAKIIRVYKLMAFASRCLFFNPFMDINQLCDQAVVFLVVLIFFQIPFPIPELQGNMVFIPLNIQIIYFFFLIRL